MQEKQEKLQLFFQYLKKNELKCLLDLIPENVIILKKPESGLIMMTCKDPFDTDFYLGEILVTEAQVSWNEQQGYGMIIGSENEYAYLAAWIDALFKGSDVELQKKINYIIEQLDNLLSEKQSKEAFLTDCTRVEFESMVRG
jgi:phosphonate C-P lyase system protein PhnG